MTEEQLRKALNATNTKSLLNFPYDDSKDRLTRYEFNDKLFEGNHFDAFKLKINDQRYNKDYEALKYVSSNFAGLISKVSADMLFSEPIKVKAEDGDQEFIDSLISQNKLNTQNYESALANSRHGDAVFKLRIGKLNPGDEDMTVIIEDITPSIYFPTLSQDNIRQEPEEKELAWVVKIGNKDYLRKEIHRPGSIENRLYLLEGNKIKQEVSLGLLEDPDIKEYEETKISKSLIVHVPNWRDGSRYFGYDDYSDLKSLFYAVNNRMTKTENILDKHSDPILALPEGVIDEEGKVNKEAFHLFEIPEAGMGQVAKPEYIVWNASLDSNFKHIDKLMEFLFMFSETSPDVLGMGKGQSDSGRALKLKLMRTIAKIARKRTYYDIALKEIIHTAQLLAKAWGIGVYNPKNDKYDLKLTSDIVIPEIEWADGLPIDPQEAIEQEKLRLESGNTTVKDSIMRLDGIDDKAAEDKVREIKEEGSIDLPTSAPKPVKPSVMGVNNDNTQMIDMTKENNNG